jgi:hypothetical protein
VGFTFQPEIRRRSLAWLSLAVNQRRPRSRHDRSGWRRGHTGP